MTDIDEMKWIFFFAVVFGPIIIIGAGWLLARALLLARNGHG
jgi:hypothetical protein